MQLLKKINHTAIELDCEIETRGNTARAKQLKIKLAALKARLT